ncbi:hypothetical protein VY88_32915 [Azospirillum thiophilum]|uniref:HNH endonuclease n=2 Tax=Azospirillum thiophilum TaxID=528244 RepID=A0AAC8ZX12_9PROT|nr:hypothetical protein [Azospirillum thiophilum]ALG75731.1 hypothetical protein AL072_32855 [Azospirillum thiophilum]KJR61206.1 hypothetical protein VY88_32915 [Azospirillum thiophilum]
MPIQRRYRFLYPIDWPQISQRIRFVVAEGRCQHCARPHGREVRCLPDGRWYDSDVGTWRDSHGHQAPWPDIVEAVTMKRTRVILAACHKDHDPTNNRSANLVALCQRCHMLHDREEHRRRFRVTILLRRALGDLFGGAYRY